jgi:hypothetical protein
MGGKARAASKTTLSPSDSDTDSNQQHQTRGVLKKAVKNAQNSGKHAVFGVGSVIRGTGNIIRGAVSATIGGAVGSSGHVVSNIGQKHIAEGYRDEEEFMEQMKPYLPQGGRAITDPDSTELTEEEDPQCMDTSATLDGQQDSESQALMDGELFRMPVSNVELIPIGDRQLPEANHSTNVVWGIFFEGDEPAYTEALPVEPYQPLWLQESVEAEAESLTKDRDREGKRSTSSDVNSSNVPDSSGEVSADADANANESDSESDAESAINSDWEQENCLQEGNALPERPDIQKLSKRIAVSEERKAATESVTVIAQFAEYGGSTLKESGKDRLRAGGRQIWTGSRAVLRAPWELLHRTSHSIAGTGSSSCSHPQAACLPESCSLRAGDSGQIPEDVYQPVFTPETIGYRLPPGVEPLQDDEVS